MALFRRANVYFIEGKNFAKKFVVKAEFYLFHVCSEIFVNKKINLPQWISWNAWKKRKILLGFSQNMHQTAALYEEESKRHYMKFDVLLVRHFISPTLTLRRLKNLPGDWIMLLLREKHMGRVVFEIFRYIQKG